MTNLALIDADILVWLASYKRDYMYESQEYIKYKLDEILKNTDSYHYMFFINGSGNFRYFVRDDYKSHRKGKEKPELFDAVRQYFIDDLNAFVSVGCETDDTIVSTAKYVKDNKLFNPIVCSIDKDFAVKPLTIYKWERETINKPSELFTVDESQAFYNMCKMMLVGDRGDNIITCDGIGDKKAEKILADKNKFGMILALARTYKKFYGYKWRLKFEEVYKLLNLVDNYNIVKIPKEYNFVL